MTVVKSINVAPVAILYVPRNHQFAATCCINAFYVGIVRHSTERLPELNRILSSKNRQETISS